jgi:DNA-directed RNA polymerase specialized sigma24 family protein
MPSRSPVPAAIGDEPVLFREHHPRLRSHVGRLVRTSRANIEDACSFACLQLLRHQPDREHVYGWLLRTATREAIKLDQQARRAVRSHTARTTTARMNPLMNAHAQRSPSSCSPPEKLSRPPG